VDAAPQRPLGHAEGDRRLPPELALEIDEDKRGTLEPGRLADLAVLDKDYLTVPTQEIAGLTALLTMVGGRIVHAVDVFEPPAPGWAK